MAGVGTIANEFAEAAIEPNINPVRMAREIVSSGQWDMDTVGQMSERQTTDLAARMNNVVNKSAVMADDVLDRIERGDNTRTGAELEEYYSKGERIHEPEIRGAVADFADGNITRAEADALIQERQQFWQEDIPAKIDEAQQPDAADPGVTASVRQQFTPGMGSGMA
ncbi:MAG: hypothetical protein KKA05_07800 [Alphaproteobacteria bacterium]|nr:hypothetical protein [Alphaproteobacteria bacterium]